MQRFLSACFFSWLDASILPAYKGKLTLNSLPPWPLVPESSLLWDNKGTIIIGVMARLLVTAGSIFGSTYLLRSLLSWLEEGGNQGLGYLWALMLVLNYLGTAFCSHHAFWAGCLIALRLKESLTSRLYAACLIKQTPAPDNYLAVDVEKVSAFGMYLFHSLIAPIDALVIFAMLLWLLGYAAIPCILGVLLLFPLQYYFSLKMVQWRPLVMRASDARLSLLKEGLENIKGVKCHTWEEPIIQRLRLFRGQEVQKLLQIALIRNGNQVLAWGGMVLLLIATWSTFYLMGREMKAEDVYAVLGLLNSLRTTMEISLMGLKLGSEGYAAWKRLQSFYNKPPLILQRREGLGINLQEASFSWGDAGFKLSGLTLISRDEFIGVRGATGSGKSALIQACLGEMPLVEGLASLPRSVGYASQTPWICKGSIRENILSHRTMEEERYQRVLSICLLDQDLLSLEAGDQSSVLTLSGGQKQRVGLARCLYGEHDAYFLDDPYSALDQRMGWQVSLGVKEFLRGKVVILTSSQECYLSLCERVLLLEDGEAKEVEIPKPLNLPNPEALIQVTSKVSSTTVKLSSQPSSTLTSLRIYFQTCGGGLWLCLLLLLSSQPLKIGFDWWLGRWIRDSYSLSNIEYLGIYIALGGGFIALFLLEGLLFPYITLRGGSRFNQKFNTALLATPLSFHQQQALGDLLNRASRDQSLIDETVSDTGHRLLIYGGSVCSTFALMVVILPWMSLLLGLVIVGYLYCGFLFRSCIASLKRLEGETRSKLHSLVVDNYQGASILRAEEMLSIKEPYFLQTLESNLRANQGLYGFMRWFGLRAEVLSASILLGISLLIVREDIEPETAGLVLAYALQTVGTLQWLMRLVLEEEVALLAVDRVGIFATSLAREQGGKDLEMPSGDLHLEQVEVYYSKPQAALSLSLHIKEGECIGVKGRTGSGKSTLLAVLQRLIEYQGKVILGGKDLREVNLQTLRGGIGALPQEPCFLPSLSLQWNLDPCNIHTPVELKQALTRCHLDTLTDKLGVYFKELQLSAGQRQLLALSRLLLSKPKIVIIDEATSSLDAESTSIVEKLIETELSGATRLLVSHRPSSLSICNRVITLNQGRIEA